MATALWTYREEVVEPVSDLDLTGFRVEAKDGEIGKVDKASYEAGTSSIIVDTGPWILGKKVLLPAGTIESIDFEDGTIYVDRSKDEIKKAPEWDPSGYVEQETRLALGDYYGRFYG
jgi:hypothetical protein